MTAHGPKVSILIPVYNTEAYISESINSVLNQSYQDLELVIVDDCSTDDTYTICQQFAKMDQRIKLYRNEHNLGMMANWIHGIGFCKGLYWGKLDADDIWHPEILASNVKILDSDQQVGLVATNYICIDENGKTVPGSQYSFPDFARNRAVSFVPFVKEGIDKIFSHGIAQQGIGLLRRSIFDELGTFTLLPAGDTEMWFRIAGHYQVYCHNETMHFHRIWQDSFTKTEVLKENKFAQNLYDARMAIINYYSSANLIDKKCCQQLTQANEWEFNKTRIVNHRAKKEWLKAAMVLANSFNIDFLKTLSFYGERLKERLNE